MEPGTNPANNPFDPKNYRPAQNRVKRSHWAVMIFLLVALIVAVCWLVVRSARKASGWFHNNVNAYVAEGKYTGKRLDTNYTLPFDPAVKTAKLTLNGGTCIYKISDTTKDLFRADAMLFYGRYALNSHKEGSDYVMDLAMTTKTSVKTGTHSDSVNLKLNTAPTWDIDVNSGATDLDFDLSKYKIRNFSIHGSAGEFSVKLGHPLPQTDVKLAVGAADVTIKVPKDAGCRIEEHSALSSTTFDGFNKKDDGAYETDGFSSAKNKIVIHFSGGISDFKVNRY
ncbi:MAG: hypothetical protein JST19_09290 [Bacteroidetes bacterium]|nr:hypothetical protein [Bacteroidota bacterium]